MLNNWDCSAPIEVKIWMCYIELINKRVNPKDMVLNI